MKKLSSSLLGLSLAVIGTCSSVAQEKPAGDASAPKVLQITREYTKAGKAGMVHDKAESAFVQAMARAKWPTHYLGMTSLSGKQRALFLTWYASFEAWDKDMAAVAKNSTLSNALDRASMADGELLDSMDQGVFLRRDDLSLRPRPDISQMRYMEIYRAHVKPGHEKEWIQALKMINAGFQKAVPEAHWATFEQIYGSTEGTTYLFLTSRKSLAEVDHAGEEGKKFEAAMGEDGMKKLDELIAASEASYAQQLFVFNPHMSYVSDDWVKSDPDFWRPKAAAAPMAMPGMEGKKVKP